MRHPREVFQLVPQRLAIGEVPQLARLEKVARQIAHLQQELQIAALRGGRGAGPLENLDHASGILVELDRPEDQQEIAVVRGLAVLPFAGARLHKAAFAAGHDLLQQLAVGVEAFLVVGQVRFAQVALILEFQAARLADRPNGAADGR